MALPSPGGWCSGTIPTYLKLLGRVLLVRAPYLGPNSMAWAVWRSQRSARNFQPEHHRFLFSDQKHHS